MSYNEDMRIYLDNVDITGDLMKQTEVPNLSGGVYPNMGKKWYNLLPIIEKHTELKPFFSSGGLHHLKIEDDPGYEFKAKIILRMCYSARNS